MTGNAPLFDPVYPTAEEQADMVAGFRAAYAGSEKPAITSEAWDHGYRAGRGDVTGNIDDDMRIIARRHVAISRGEPDPSPPVRTAASCAPRR